MNKNIILVLCGLLLVTFIGCGTIKGIGEDIKAAGGWIAKSSDTVKDSVK